jgi:hypothetical protein
VPSGVSIAPSLEMVSMNLAAGHQRLSTFITWTTETTGFTEI